MKDLSVLTLTRINSSHCLCCLSLFLGVCGQQAFKTEPRNVTVRAGATVLLKCEVLRASGAVQWVKDGLPPGTSEITAWLPTLQHDRRPAERWELGGMERMTCGGLKTTSTSCWDVCWHVVRCAWASNCPQRARECGNSSPNRLSGKCYSTLYKLGWIWEIKALFIYYQGLTLTFLLTRHCG